MRVSTPPRRTGSNVDFVKLFALLAVLAAGFWSTLDATGVWDVTDKQTALLVLVTVNLVGLAAALLAHFQVYTPSEPLAVGAAVALVVNSSIGVAVGFEVVHWNDATIAVVMGFVNTALLVIGVVVARQYVTPTLREQRNPAAFEHGFASEDHGR